MAEDDIRPPRLTLGGLFLKFLGFGCLAFGGPVAQIAMIRQALVEEERWISSARFNRLLAVMQILPGPEAHELCVHMGMLARGRIGGVLAGLGFMLPGLLLMLLLAEGYALFVAGRAGLAGVLLGIQIAVLAIVVRAVHRIGGHVLETRGLVAIALVAAAATVAGIPFWLTLAAGGVVWALAARPMLALGVAIMAGALATLLLLRPASGADPIASAGAVGLAALFVAGLKGGLLTFGGAYTAIPYVRADTVGRGWLGDGAFLDGVAFANMLPAPLVIFAAFAGYLAAGPAGALAITAGMFLPAFAFSLIFFERLERLVDHPRLQRLLSGVAAAVVGVIAATCVDLGRGTLARVEAVVPALLLFAVLLVAAWRLKGKLVAPLLVSAGGVAGFAVL